MTTREDKLRILADYAEEVGLDDDGYPTDATLKRIAEWDAADREGALELVRSLWRWPNYATRNGDEFEFITGGWSGNESLISALEENLLIKAMCWWSSERGGRHVWKLS